MTSPVVERHPSGIGYHIVVDPKDPHSPTIQRSSGAGFALHEADAMVAKLEQMKRETLEKQNAIGSL